MRVPRFDVPLNDYRDQDLILMGAFWWLWPLQGTWLTTGPLKKAMVTHLLLQHSQTFAHDVDFLMYVNSQRLRVEAAQAVAARMKWTPHAWAQYRACLLYTSDAADE